MSYMVYTISIIGYCYLQLRLATYVFHLKREIVSKYIIKQGIIWIN